MGAVIGISLPLEIAAISTAISLALGLALAWLLTHRQFPGNREIGWVATAALALPAPVVCYVVFLNPRQVLWQIAAVGVLSAAPIVTRGGRTALASLDPVYGRTGRSLGSSDWRVFWRIELPLVWRQTAAATAVALARVFVETVAALLIAARPAS